MTDVSPIRLKIYDVDFYGAAHPGNKVFYSYVRSLIKDGSYSSDYDERRKDEVVARIQEYMSRCDPPTRFLKRKTQKGGTVKYVILSGQESIQKIKNQLQRLWRESGGILNGKEGNSISGKQKQEHKQFNLLIKYLAEDKIYHDNDDKKRKQLVCEIRKYMKACFPEGLYGCLPKKQIEIRILSVLDKEIPRFKERGKRIPQIRSDPPDDSALI